MSKRDLTILGCASQQHTRTRNHGAYLVRWNGSGFLFDPGEGTQRQLIFAEIAPTCINYIFISHFHGDHCLGLGSMLLRLNLDNVTHQIHCFYPASGKKYFDALRYSSIYHERIHVVEHPISKEGVVFQNEEFTVEAYALLHGVDNLGWRVTEASTRKYDPEKLRAKGVFGMDIKALAQNGTVTTSAGTVVLDDVSTIRQGDTFAIAIDTLPTPNIEKIAKGSRLFLCEATYLDKDRDIAKSHNHLTAKQAAEAAKRAGAQELVLTHFSARYLDLRPFIEEASAIFPNVHVAEDLKVIDFPKNPPKETE